MLIVMDKNATDPQVDAVLKLIGDMGFTPVPVPGTQRTAIKVHLIFHDVAPLASGYF